MKKIICLFLFLFVYMNISYACESGHWISDKSSDGSIIFLEDGSKWLVDYSDRIDTALWMVMDDITLCDENGYLINTSNNPPENADVEQIQ